ncbi:unnamed protein product, partial [Pylaiella littoralis]
QWHPPGCGAIRNAKSLTRGVVSCVEYGSKPTPVRRGAFPRSFVSVCVIPEPFCHGIICPRRTHSPTHPPTLVLFLCAVFCACSRTTTIEEPLLGLGLFRSWVRFRCAFLYIRTYAF